MSQPLLLPRPWAALVAVGVTLVCGVATSNAQDSSWTRASEAEAARRAKAAAVAEAPPPNKVERAFNFIEESRLFGKIFNPPRGWFAQVGGVSEGNGFTLGGGYRETTPFGVVTARSVGSLRQSFLAGVDITQRFLPRDAGFVTASVVRRHEAVQRFYGLGAETSFDDQSSFGLSAVQADLVAGVQIAHWLTASAGIGYFNPDLTSSSEKSRVPDVADRFPADTLPGQARQPNFLTTQLGLIVDTRDTPNPRSGGLYQATVRRFDDRDGGAYTFTDTRIDLQQFVPFWNLSRVLALRVLAHHADGIGQAQVPFYLMPTLGGARVLRGYDRQRFRDRSLLLLSAEYRYEVNPFLMAAIFYDAGQVAPDWTDFRLKDLRDAYGVGFRFGYSNAVALRADIAFGGEDPVRLILGFSTSF